MKTFEQMYNNTLLAEELKYNNIVLTTDNDGDAVYRTRQTAQNQPTLESESMNPFAIPEVEGERETPAEFAGTIASGTAGTLGGATAVTIGLPVDIAGMIAGIATGLSAEDGEKLATGLETWSQFSEFAGSEASLNALYGLIDNAPLSDEAKQDMREGSRLLGEWAELPGAIKGTATAAKLIAAGLRQVKKGKSLEDPVQIVIPYNENMPAEPAQ